MRSWFLKKLDDSDVATGSERASIPDESIRVDVACNVTCSGTEEWKVVFKFRRPRTVHHGLHLVD